MTEEIRNKILENYTTALEYMHEETMGSENNYDAVGEKLENVGKIIADLPDSEVKDAVKNYLNIKKNDYYSFYSIKRNIELADDEEKLNNCKIAIEAINDETLKEQLTGFVNSKAMNIDGDDPKPKDKKDKDNKDIKEDEKEEDKKNKDEDEKEEDKKNKDEDEKDKEEKDDKDKKEKKDEKDKDTEDLVPTPEDKPEELIEVQIKQKAPEKTWKTAAMVAAGVGIGAGAFFIAGPGGCAAVAVAGLIAKRIIRKKRQALAEQKLNDKKNGVPVEEAVPPEGKLGRAIFNLKKYLNSDEGLRDLEWLASAATITGAAGAAGGGVFNIVDYTFVPTTWAAVAGTGSALAAGGITSRVVKNGEVVTTVKVPKTKTPAEIAEMYGVEEDQILMPLEEHKNEDDKKTMLEEDNKLMLEEHGRAM